jgi:hypothetical protein
MPCVNLAGNPRHWLKNAVASSTGVPLAGFANAQMIQNYQVSQLTMGKSTLLAMNQQQVASQAQQTNFNIAQHDAKWQSSATSQFESALKAAGIGMVHDVLSTIQMGALVLWSFRQNFRHSLRWPWQRVWETRRYITKKGTTWRRDYPCCR